MRENRKAIDWTPYLESACQKYAHWRELYTFTDAEGKKSRSPKDSCLLDLRVETLANERQQPGEREEKTERFAVLEGLRKYAPNHVLLVGRPGSGKSTALARLLWEEAKANLEPLPQPLSYKEREVRIPILVELRYYQTSIFDLILDFLQRHELRCDRDTLESILIQQSCLLLFDGINELPSEEARRDLQQFRQKYAKVPAIFTTRDIGLGGDLNLEKKLEMLPLSEPQMREFVCTYLPETGEQMLKKLGTRLKDFGQTPLLLWMLCSVFKSNGNQIPANLGLVFREFTKIYDSKLKHDVPTYKEAREWWRELLQELAWKMTQGDSKTEIQVAIDRREAEAIFREYLQGKVEYAENCAKQWLKDLLKHHLIQLESRDKIAFRHQLIQEYYTAEALFQQLPNLSDEALQWNYLNYLKWTEPVALMLGMLADKEQAVRAVKVALSVDLRLGSRLAGEVNPEWQRATVDLILKLNLPQLLSIELLAATRSQTASEKLIKALEHPEFWVRRSAAYALGNIGSDAAIDGLIKALEDHSYNVRWSAAYALNQIHSDAAIPGLIKALEDSGDDVCISAADALGKIGSEAATNRLINELIKALEHPEFDVRIKATEALGKIGSEVAISGLIKALEDHSYNVRINAAEALGKIGSEVAIPGLIKALEDHSYNVRINAAEALGKIGSEVAIPGLIKALEDHSYNVRISAAEALGKIGSEAAIPGLIKALEDRTYSVRISVAEALGKIGSEAAIPGLIKALEDSGDDVRISAADALGKIGSEVAIPGLIKALEDSGDDVRISAADALGKIGSEVAIPGLIKALKERIYNYNVRSSAADALGQIGSEAAIDGLIKALEDSGDDVRSSAADALGQIGSEAAIDGLIKALEDSGDDVRRSAADALGKIGSEAAIPELISRLQNPLWVILNEGNTFFHAIEALEAIQNKLKYYSPIYKVMNRQVYISYNWQEDSNEMANRLVAAFEAKGITIIRDKTHVNYKDSIKTFMQQLGKGKCVLAVISDKYLRSENCMFELVEIAKHGEFRNRIFPVVLKDAKIHKDIERIDYLEYWEQQKAKLQEKYKKIDLASTTGIMETLDLYNEIRRNIDNLTNILKDMNTLTSDLHMESGFQAIIQAVETKLIEDNQKITPTPNTPK